MPVTACPQCGMKLRAPDATVGKLVSCPKCGMQFLATTDSAAPLSSPPTAAGAPPPAPDTELPEQARVHPGYAPWTAYPPKPPTSGMAVASLVLGIAAIPTCLFYGIPSLVCGILAVVFAKKARAQIDSGMAAPSSEGMARAGKICGWVGIGLSIAFLASLVIFIIIAVIGNVASS